MGFNVFGTLIGVYNSTIQTLSDGDYGVLSLDENGRVIVTASDLDIRDLSASQDNIAISDGTDTLAINADGSINVVATATDLDIRDLSASQDNVAISDGTDTLAINADGSINVVATATDLDIRDLSASQDNVAISDGTDTLAINADGSINVVATATDLDIRDLSASQDSVKIGDGTDFLDILGWDDASAGTEKGILPFAVRKDTDGSIVSADGDFAPLQVDANGKLKVAGTFDVNVDDIFESGTEGDVSSDSTGDGIVAITNSMTDLVSVSVGAGTTYYLLGLDVAADKNSTYELVIEDNGTPSEWIRVGNLSGGQLDVHKEFKRAIEISGAANRILKLRAAVSQGNSGNAAGAINGYTR